MRSRTAARVLSFWFVAVLAPVSAHGQAAKPIPLFTPIPGIHYGFPLKWSGSLAVSLPGGGHHGMNFIAIEPGLGGGRINLGYLNMLGDLGTAYVARASFLRTNASPWRAPKNASFVGAEFQYMYVFMIGMRVGAFVGVGGAAAGQRLLAVDFSVMH